MLDNDKTRIGSEPVSTRARAMSDSLRSSRAEKRMGRLFKQQASSSNVSDLDQTPIPLEPVPERDRSFSHGMQSDNQRRFLANQERITPNHGHSLSFDRLNEKQQQQSQHNAPTRNSSIDMNSQKSNNSQSNSESSDHEISQPKNKTREGVKMLSTLTGVGRHTKLPLDSLIQMAKYFKGFFEQLISVVSELDANIDSKLKSHNVFLVVLDTAEKNLAKPTSSKVSDDIRSHLSLCMSQCMNDSISLIENLRLLLTPNRYTVDSLKMIYFAVFSLFSEMVTICKRIVPVSKPIKKAKQLQNAQSFSQTSSQTSSQMQLPSHARSKSQLQSQNYLPPPLPTQRPPHSQQLSSSKLKPSLSINRIPAPSPSGANQTLPVSSRQASGRSFSLMRQESDLNPGVTPVDTLLNDEKLFESIHQTIQAAQVVYSQVNTAISKSAISTAQAPTDGKTEELDNIALKVKELTSHCMNSMEKTRRTKVALQMVMQQSQGTNVEDTHRTLYETTNLFLKSIIAILAATKGAIHDLPALNEVRSSLSNLTRATKELTIKLETSSLKNFVVSSTTVDSNLIEQPPLSSIPSLSAFPSSGAMSALSTSNPMTFDFRDYPSSASAATTFASAQSMNPLARHSSLRIAPVNSAPLNMSTTNLRQDILETKGPSTSLDSMQQHIKTLQQNTTKSVTDPSLQTPLSVTTPLIASIGATAASAVLPISSPLKTLGESKVTKSSSNPNIHQALTSFSSKQSQSHERPQQLQQETNPFDRTILQQIK